MKSFITMPKAQKKMLRNYIKAEVDEYVNIQRSYLIFRLLGLICMDMNETEGYARKRLCRLVHRLGENFKQLDSWKDDADDLLILNLRRIHMDELADALQGEVDKLRREIEES